MSDTIHPESTAAELSAFLKSLQQKIPDNVLPSFISKSPLNMKKTGRSV
jgi:hypothetical protein